MEKNTKEKNLKEKQQVKNTKSKIKLPEPCWIVPLTLQRANRKLDGWREEEINGRKNVNESNQNGPIRIKHQSTLIKLLHISLPGN